MVPLPSLFLILVLRLGGETSLRRSSSVLVRARTLPYESFSLLMTAGARCPLLLLLFRASIPTTLDPFRLLGGLCDVMRASRAHSRSFTSFLAFDDPLEPVGVPAAEAGPPTMVVVV